VYLEVVLKFYVRNFSNSV